LDKEIVVGSAFKQHDNHTDEGWRIIIDITEIIESAHPIEWETREVLFFAK